MVTARTTGRSATAVIAAVVTMVAATTMGGLGGRAFAVESPGVDPAALPGPGTPGPEQAMKQTAKCVAPVAVAQPDIKLPAPGFAMLNIERAWQFSTGAGVTVGVIDTGVTPNPRLPRLYAGGDYVTGAAGSGGLEDCDAHGTIVASIIGAQPSDPARLPARRPENAAQLPPPPPPPGQGEPATLSPEPPKPVTVTVQTPAPPPPPPSSPAPPPPPWAAPAPAPGPPPPPRSRPRGAGFHRPLPAQVAPPRDAEGVRVGPALAPHPPPSPAPAPPPPAGNDGFVGVAPDSAIISIRQSSEAFSPVMGGFDPDGRIRKAGDLMTLAKSIRRIADLGARVINLSVQACMNANDLINDAAVGAALNYAVTIKDAVVVAAAGNTGEKGCGQNPVFDPLRADDPRDWHQVSTVVTPAWYAGSDLVLTVGGVDVGPDKGGTPMPNSIAGPWVQVAAPGTPIIGLSNGPGGGAVSAKLDPLKPGETVPFWGTSYAAPFVAGVAALVRARFPSLSAHQVMRRIVETAHNPARGVDNQVGFGVVDPVLALTADVDEGPRLPVAHLSQRVPRPVVPAAPDHTPRTVALMCTALVVLVAAAAAGAAGLRRKRRPR